MILLVALCAPAFLVPTTLAPRAAVAATPLVRAPALNMAVDYPHATVTASPLIRAPALNMAVDYPQIANTQSPPPARSR